IFSTSHQDRRTSRQRVREKSPDFLAPAEAAPNAELQVVQSLLVKRSGVTPDDPAILIHEQEGRESFDVQLLGHGTPGPPVPQERAVIKLVGAGDLADQRDLLGPRAAARVADADHFQAILAVFRLQPLQMRDTVTAGPTVG